MRRNLAIYWVCCTIQWQRVLRLPWLLSVLALFSVFSLVHPAVVALMQIDSHEIVGYQSVSYENTRLASPTADKSQNKLWWNDGHWWADMISERTNRHHIFRLNWEQQVWSETDTELDPRPRSKSDILWDDETQKLYVASTGYATADTAEHMTRGVLFRYSYDSPTQSYHLDEGFPVLIMSGSSPSLTLARDSTGQLWITYIQQQQVMLRHSLDDDRLWSAPFSLPTEADGVTDGDISALLAFDAKIGVAWSNQGVDAMYFAIHEDGAAPDDWHQEVVIQGERYADNHLHLAADSSGRVYVAAKTSRSDPLAALVVIYVRDTSGRWLGHVFGYGRDQHTRPSIIIDDDNELLYMFATSPQSGGAIYYKSTPLDNISFAAGTGTLVLSHPEATYLNDVTTTRQHVTGETGLVVVASDRHTRRYYHNFVPLD